MRPAARCSRSCSTTWTPGGHRWQGPCCPQTRARRCQPPSSCSSQGGRRPRQLCTSSELHAQDACVHVLHRAMHMLSAFVHCPRVLDRLRVLTQCDACCATWLHGTLRTHDQLLALGCCVALFNRHFRQPEAYVPCADAGTTTSSNISCLTQPQLQHLLSSRISPSVRLARLP